MNEMYAAEQINIPTELGTVLKLLTKAAIRDKPTADDVNKWAANFFTTQCNRPAVFDENGKLTDAGREAAPHSAAFIAGQQQSRQNAQQQSQGNDDSGAAAQNTSAGAASGDDDQQQEQKIVDALFDKYDQDRSNLIPHNVLPSLIMDLKSELGLAFTHEQMEQFVNEMPADDNGLVDLEEFRVAFFQG